MGSGRSHYSSGQNPQQVPQIEQNYLYLSPVAQGGGMDPMGYEITP